MSSPYLSVSDRRSQVAGHMSYLMDCVWGVGARFQNRKLCGVWEKLDCGRCILSPQDEQYQQEKSTK